MMAEKKFTPLIEYIKEKSGLEFQMTNPGFPVEKYRGGDVIFSEGSKGYSAYIMKSGRVEISVMVSGEKVVLAMLEEKSVFGEMALVLEAHNRTATATALGDSEVVKISKDAFDKYMKDSPRLISVCLIAIAGRLQETTTKASRIPDAFLGVSQILHLFSVHDKEELSYGKTVDAISKALLKEKTEIAKVLSMMESFNLLEWKKSQKGEKSIRLIAGSDFMGKSLKINEILKGYKS
jgi:CRP/FNR family transcriptional regulator, cyclic AMP receptor protein